MDSLTVDQSRFIFQYVLGQMKDIDQVAAVSWWLDVDGLGFGEGENSRGDTLGSTSAKDLVANDLAIAREEISLHHRVNEDRALRVYETSALVGHECSEYDVNKGGFSFLPVSNSTLSDNYGSENGMLSMYLQHPQA